jgi:hypothetical protein
MYVYCDGEVYSIKQYVIKFVSDLRQEWWFSPGSAVSSTNKTDSHNINEILIMRWSYVIAPYTCDMVIKNVVQVLLN